MLNEASAATLELPNSSPSVLHTCPCHYTHSCSTLPSTLQVVNYTCCLIRAGAPLTFAQAPFLVYLQSLTHMGVTSLVGAPMRKRIRDKYGLPEDPCNDHMVRQACMEY